MAHLTSYIAHLSTPHILILLHAIFLARIIYLLTLHPLSPIPGPPLARVSELWRSVRYFRGTWHTDILALHKQYGPVVRIAPNEVSVVDESVVGSVYGHAKAARKTGCYDVWKSMSGTSGDDEKLDSLFPTTDPKAHAFFRRRVANLYSMSSVLGWDAQIQAIADTLWTKFHAFAQSGEAVDMHVWASLFTFDAVSTICAGQPAGFVARGADVDGWIGNVHGSFYWAANMGNIPGSGTWLTNPVLLRLLSVFDRRVARYVPEMSGFIINMLQHHHEAGDKAAEWENKEKEKAGKKNMLTTLTTMKDIRGAPAPPEHMFSEIGNILTAGDTTSVGLRAVLGPLLLDRARYRRLRAEIDAAYATWHASTGPDGNTNTGIALPYSVTKDLPYLSACVKEGMRLHPSIIYQLPREVPVGGVQVGGYTVPAGCAVGVSALAQNRCAGVFGRDADGFRPERWIVGEEGEGYSDEARVKRMERFNATFGYGARVCVGKNIALYETYKFVSQLLWQFDVELVHPERPWVLEAAWVSFQKDMFVRFRARRHGVEG